MARTAGRTRLEGVVTTIAALAGGLAVWGLFGFVGRLPWSAGREADWWLECRRSPCWTGPSGGWLSGDGSAGLLGSGCAEIPEGSGRENSEDCFVGRGCDENCWGLPPPPCYIALGRVRVWRPVAQRSNRMLVAKVVKGSCWVWLIKMLCLRCAGCVFGFEGGCGSGGL